MRACGPTMSRNCWRRRGSTEADCLNGEERSNGGKAEASGEWGVARRRKQRCSGQPLRGSGAGGGEWGGGQSRSPSHSPAQALRGSGQASTAWPVALGTARKKRAGHFGRGDSWEMEGRSRRDLSMRSSRRREGERKSGGPSQAQGKPFEDRGQAGPKQSVDPEVSFQDENAYAKRKATQEAWRNYGAAARGTGLKTGHYRRLYIDRDDGAAGRWVRRGRRLGICRWLLPRCRRCFHFGLRRLRPGVGCARRRGVGGNR